MKRFLISMILLFAAISAYLLFFAIDIDNPSPMDDMHSYYSWLSLGMAIVFSVAYLITLFNDKK